MEVKATDPSGNFAWCNYTVIVSDTEPPVITCPPDIVERTELLQNDNTITWSPPAVWDNYDLGGNTASCYDESGQLVVSGDRFVWLSAPTVGDVHTIMCNISDAGDRSDECTFTIRVYDPEPPRLQNCTEIYIGNATVHFPNVCTDIDPVVMMELDNVGVVTDTLSSLSHHGGDPPSTWDVGSHIVTAYAQDADGNEDRCNITVTCQPYVPYCGDGVLNGDE